MYTYSIPLQYCILHLRIQCKNGNIVRTWIRRGLGVELHEQKLNSDLKITKKVLFTTQVRDN
jgi:hypothetical protein